MLARKPSYFILATADVIGEKFTRISHKPRCEVFCGAFLQKSDPNPSQTNFFKKFPHKIRFKLTLITKIKDQFSVLFFF